MISNIIELFDKSIIDNGLVILPFVYRLVIDTGLVILLLLSTLIGNILVANFWIGLIGLQSLSFGAMKRISFFGTILMAIPSFLPVVMSSYIYGCIACAANKEFNYSDVMLVSIFCFLGMFTIMRGAEILGDLEMSGNVNQTDYSHLCSLLERIDESLTPAIIITLLMMSGLIFSCYFNNIN